MNEDYTFHKAVNAIDRATITGRPFPRALRDNGQVAPLLCLDWARRADRDAWLDFFGAPASDDPDLYSRWARDWHGWTVLMTAPDEDSVAGGENTRIPPAVAGTALLAEGEAVAADLMTGDLDGTTALDIAADKLGSTIEFPQLDCGASLDSWVDAVATRVHGLHRAEDLDRLPTVLAALDPDATIQLPCGQSTRHEVHGSHTRHVGAYTRSCFGWDAPTVTIATQPLPPGVAGYAVAPDVHTGQPEPERDGWLADWAPPACRVPYVRDAGLGIPAAVSLCERPAGHLGDHVDHSENAWANEYTDMAYRTVTP